MYFWIAAVQSSWISLRKMSLVRSNIPLSGRQCNPLWKVRQLLSSTLLDVWLLSTMREARPPLTKCQYQCKSNFSENKRLMHNFSTTEQFVTNIEMYFSFSLSGQKWTNICINICPVGLSIYLFIYIIRTIWNMKPLVILRMCPFEKGSKGEEKPSAGN